MNVSAVSVRVPKNVTFKSRQQSQTNFQRRQKREKRLNFLSTIGCGVLVGATTSAISSRMISGTSNARAFKIFAMGIAATFGTLAFTLPATICDENI